MTWFTSAQGREGDLGVGRAGGPGGLAGGTLCRSSSGPHPGDLVPSGALPPSMHRNPPGDGPPSSLPIAMATAELASSDPGGLELEPLLALRGPGEAARPRRGARPPPLLLASPFSAARNPPGTRSEL